jgi:ligand-binding sensor domain-containing protein
MLQDAPMLPFASTSLPFRVLAAWILGGMILLGSCSSPTGHLLRETSGIRGIYEDHQGNFWLSSTEWVAKYEPSARTTTESGFTYYSQNLPGILLGAYKEDSSGRMWLQNEDGIHRHDGERFVRLENRDYNSRDQWALADGDLWFGLDRGLGFTEEEAEWGVYRVHDGVCTFLAFPPPPAGERQKFYPLTSDVMHGKDGSVWFGTFTAAYGYDGESWDIIGRERLGRGDDSAYVGIRGYHLDSRGLLWMADNGAGVYVYDGTEIHHFTAIHNLREADVDGNSLHRSFSISEDADGNIWIGTAYSGLWRYQPSKDDPIGKGSFTNYDDAEGWPCENTWTIYQTRNGELLFAGEDPGGVYRFNGKSLERVF